MFKRKKGHRNFRILGLACTQNEMTTSVSPPFEYYLYVPGKRMGSNSIYQLRIAAWKYRLGFKEWFK